MTQDGRWLAAISATDAIWSQLPGWVTLPVMMVTAYDDDERKRRAGDLGACDFLAKPVDFAYLRTRLSQFQAP